MEATMSQEKLSFELFKSSVLRDYRIACLSREISLLGRKEVLGGKAKFGIFGDGKEVAQVAMAKFFKPGDFRSGYYRDQTFVLAAEMGTGEQLFAQLYADADLGREPFSGGRQMNNFFATPFVDGTGEWLTLTNTKNSSSDIAPTAGQMPRALGLAHASRIFRDLKELHSLSHLSNQGNEVCFATIGDASTSEGHFWETMNAAAVLQVPLAVFVWDDGYGISVPKQYQTAKGSISAALEGMQRTEEESGIQIYKVKGWDYAGMCEAFEEGIGLAREKHIPVLFHVEELTQPQGHSTSGSHERYKTPERLEWEKEWDGLVKMKEWLLSNGLASASELDEIATHAKEEAKASRDKAWSEYLKPLRQLSIHAVALLNETASSVPNRQADLNALVNELEGIRSPLRRDILRILYRAIQLCNDTEAGSTLKEVYQNLKLEGQRIYNSYLYDEGPKSALKVKPVPPQFFGEAPLVNGFEVINRFFEAQFNANPKLIAFGEDLGQIGDVNQGFSGLQEKFGKTRIFDTGIRELTIMGSGIGLAMRGLRPIAEIQYLDYLLYGLQPLSDDVSTLQYRTSGKQACPIIVRTRGHRLEGIWHSGSPMGMIINALRGMHICVPRNMTQAIGMYNTLLQSNDPGLVIECLNGYRLKEKLPSNLLEFSVPLGEPEIIREGTDITIISYGSTLRIIQEAAQSLELSGISCEIVDVQTLVPFDLSQRTVKSLQKTNRILFVDEDVPGGAAAYLFNKVMEEQGGYRYLDVAPRTLTAKAHRPAYGSDGDYFSKPNAEEIEEVVREMMCE
jgi:pyruvate/2-oxoglutarate/acetoin dehydrogenase E1 component/TPP-dependent pyruvate/acetoin dehydrogenase alpha subunit